MSGLALLDKSGWAPLGAGEDQTHPILIAGVGVAMLVLVPLAWGLVRRHEGLPMFGSRTPTGTEPVEQPSGTVDQPLSPTPT